jgi:hypothetical protein
LGGGLATDPVPLADVGRDVRLPGHVAVAARLLHAARKGRLAGGVLGDALVPREVHAGLDLVVDLADALAARVVVDRLVVREGGRFGQVDTLQRQQQPGHQGQQHERGHADQHRPQQAGGGARAPGSNRWVLLHGGRMAVTMPSTV